jgi:hypothetical protein
MGSGPATPVPAVRQCHVRSTARRFPGRRTG